MTAAELSTMTPEQKRERIAVLANVRVFRFCGDSDSEGHEPYQPDNQPQICADAGCYLIKCQKCDGHRWTTTSCWEKSSDSDKYPDYLHDQNAVAEVLAGLDSDQHCAFRGALLDLLDLQTDDASDNRAYVMPDPAVAVDALLLSNL